MVYVYDVKELVKNPIFYQLLFFDSSKSMIEITEYILDNLGNTNTMGYLLVFDKNKIKFNQLTFLKELIFRLYLSGKRVKIIGLPYCFLQFIFGGFDFTRIDNIQLQANEYYFRDTVGYQSFMLRGCKNCIEVKKCEGLGVLEDNHDLWAFRVNNDVRLKNRKKLQFQDEHINSLHKYFISHCDKFSLRRTDRTIKYSNSYKIPDNSLEYTNRFVYYCRYLDLKELTNELNFIKGMVFNQQTIYSLLFKYYELRFLSGYAYTIAKIDENKFRETIYMYFTTSKQVEILLEDLKLHPPMKFDFMYPYFIGLDLSSNSTTLKEYKIYYRITNHEFFLKWLHKENIVIDNLLLNNSFKHLIVFRYDQNSKLKSIKFELTPRNNLIFIEYFKKNYDIEVVPENYLLKNEYYAIDFNLDRKVKKLTCYLSVALYR